MDKQEILDWLDGTADDLADDLRRLKALRTRFEAEGLLRRCDLDDLASVANNLGLDVERFRRLLPQ